MCFTDPPGAVTFFREGDRMKLTKALADWLRQHRKDIPADAGEDKLKAELAAALADGSLAAEKFAELSRDESTEKAASKAAVIETKLDAMAVGMNSLAETLKGVLDKMLATTAAGFAKADKAEKTEKASQPSDTKDVSAVEEKLAEGLGGGVRVKGAHEQYDSAKSAAVHPEFNRRTGRRATNAGQVVRESGEGGERTLYHPSELERAAGGAFLKFAIEGSARGRALPRQLRCTDHDKSLVQWALENAKWGGVIHGGTDGGSESPGSIALDNRKLTPSEQKALIDDTLTGGLEAAPIFFDDAVILDPILSGELFPRVNLMTVTRGRRIEAASFGNVTVRWGGGDDDPIDLFDTTGYITAFDTLIHVVDGAIELGLDFLSDSPLRVMDIVVGQYSEKLLESLDEQISIGDGSQEPEGILNASGITNVTWGGATSIGNYESLLFGVAKRFKQGFSTDSMVFCGTEQSYQRARAVPHGASDVRRVFGMDEESYMLFGHPYAINEPTGNRNVWFANLKRYRMYRRLGLTVRSTGEGKELTRKNNWLITARARFGGQLEAGGAAALTQDAPA